MTQYEVTTSGAVARPPRPAVVRDGLLCAGGGLIAAVGASVTALLPAQVSTDRMSYPYEAGTFVLTELVWTLTHVLTLFGAIGLLRSGAVAGSRAGRAGAWIAIAGMVLLLPAELSLVTVAHAAADAPLAQAISSVFGVAVTLAGIGFVVAGVAVLRSGTWSGAARWIPLLTGLFVFVVLIPVQAAAPSAFLWPIAGWNVLLALLGLVLASPGVRGHRVPPHRSPRTPQ